MSTNSTKYVLSMFFKVPSSVALYKDSIVHNTLQRSYDVRDFICFGDECPLDRMRPLNIVCSYKYIKI